MQTNISAAMLNTPLRGCLFVFIILFCSFHLSNASNSTTCDAATTCSGQGNCLQNNTCLCNPGVGGSSCNTCLPNHFVYPNCTYCHQETTCSGNGGCTKEGECFCNSAFNGSLCDRCAEGFYGYPNCKGCTAGLTCNGQGYCSLTGACICFPGYAGETCNACSPNRTLPYCDCVYPYTGTNCDVCIANHYNYPSCVECYADTTCQGQGVCSKNGTCKCDDNIIGTNCDQCAPGYYNWPSCVECNATGTCNGHGYCNNTGGCVCTDWTGTHCQTPPYYFSYNNIANASTIVTGNSVIFQAAVSSKYDGIIQGLTGTISRTSVVSPGSSSFVIFTNLYAQDPCSVQANLYINRLINVFNSTIIISLLHSYNISLLQTTGSNLNPINIAVACARGSSTTQPITLPPIVLSNTTAPPLPADSTPTPTPKSLGVTDNDKAANLQSNESAEQTVQIKKSLRIGLGLGLGLGIPFLIAAMVGIYYVSTRRPRDSYA